jgi:hypothetical protein
MAKKRLSGGRTQTLEQYTSRGFLTAMSEHLQIVRLFVSLAPEVHRLLLKSATAQQRKRSHVIEFIIQWYGGLLRNMVPAAHRDGIPAVRLIARQPLTGPETENLAGDLLDRIRLSKDDRSRLHFRRRNFSISLASSQLLNLVAVYNRLDVIQIVETLIILRLSDPIAKSKRNRKPGRLR